MGQQMARRDLPKPPSPARVRVYNGHVWLPPHQPPTRSFPVFLYGCLKERLMRCNVWRSSYSLLQSCIMDKVPCHGVGGYVRPIPIPTEPDWRHCPSLFQLCGTLVLALDGRVFYSSGLCSDCS